MTGSLTFVDFEGPELSGVPGLLVLAVLFVAFAALSLFPTIRIARRADGLIIQRLAWRTVIPLAEIRSLERDVRFRPSALTIVHGSGSRTTVFPALPMKQIDSLLLARRAE